MGDSAGERIYETGDRIEFPDVITNIGGWYNNYFHEFTCPMLGVYTFSVSVMSSIGGIARVKIMIDGIVMVTALTDGTSTAQYGHSTNIVIVECDQGQKVWAECNKDCVFYDNSFRYTTFSGMLIHAM